MEDWKQRFEVGEVVADPTGDWEPSTAEEYIDQQVTTITGDLVGETLARQTADTNLQNQVDTLAAAVGTGGTVDQRIQTEATTRANADTVLGNRITSLEQAVGSGGSIDTRISNAKSEIIGNATSACDTLGEAEAKININTNAISNEATTRATADEQLRQLYENLIQSDIIVGSLPSTGTANIIYRVPGTTSYADWMWYNSTWVKMAEYNNAIDDVPTAGSNNLVKSGGIYSAERDLSARIVNMEKSICKYTKTVKAIDGTMDGYLIWSSGGPVGFGGYSIWLYEVQNIDIISVKTTGITASGGSLAIAFFTDDALTDCLGGVSFDNYALNFGIGTHELYVNVPKNAKYFITSGATGTQSTWEVNKVVFSDVKDPKKTIVCWGDSITAGVYGNYPAWLQSIFGSDYSVINLGAGSAGLHDISARQGGVPALIKADVNVPATTEQFAMSNWNAYNVYQEYPNFQLAPPYDYANSELAYNPVMIDGVLFNFSFSTVDSTEVLKLNRLKAGNAFTIKRGTPIFPAAIGKYRDNFCVFHMGTNDTQGNVSSETLQLILSYHKDCVKSLNRKNYLILGLFNTSNGVYNVESGAWSEITISEIIQNYETYEFYMTKEFGTHFIPLRRMFASQKAIDDAVSLGYMSQATKEANATADAEWIANGCAPYSFMAYGLGDYVHPNDVGCKMIAYYVSQYYKQMCEGLFELSDNLRTL